MGTPFFSGILILFLISFFGSGPVPLPLTATVLWLGQFKLPFIVIVTATLGSLLGWLTLERSLKSWVEARPRIVQRIPGTYREIFMKKMGFWLFIFNALPLPLDFIRFLALLNGYNRTRLTIILTISRLIRNTLLVTLGGLLTEHQLLLWGVMIGFLTLPLLFGKLLQANEVQNPEPFLQPEN